jgi:hypothetical protein
MGLIRTVLVGGVSILALDTILAVQVPDIRAQPKTLLGDHKKYNKETHAQYDTFETAINLPQGVLKNNNDVNLREQFYHDFLNNPILKLQRQWASFMNNIPDKFDDNPPYEVGKSHTSLDWTVLDKNRDEILIKWVQKPEELEGVGSFQIIADKTNDYVKLRFGSGWWGTKADNWAYAPDNKFYARILLLTAAFNFTNTLVSNTTKKENEKY